MKRASLRRLHRNSALQRSALAIAVSSAILGFPDAAWGQATTGTIQGTFPVAPGEAIRVRSASGFDRTIKRGAIRHTTRSPFPSAPTRYPCCRTARSCRRRRTSVRWPQARWWWFLPVRPPARAACRPSPSPPESVPAIDVTTTNQVTTITAKDLERLPLPRDAASIAELGTGCRHGLATAVSGPLGTPINVFGGASTAENAYYIDGMNVTDALYGQGGLELPYGAIQEQQTFTSGYGAKYGRSVGGVINQIGMSGSNTWHFGARASYQPASLQSDGATPITPIRWKPRPARYPPGLLTPITKAAHSHETIYDAYVSGPIIKDKLFFFLGAEEDNGAEPPSTRRLRPDPDRRGLRRGPRHDTDYHTDAPKYYAKLNWNINDSNLLTLTWLQSAFKEWQQQLQLRLRHAAIRGLRRPGSDDKRHVQDVTWQTTLPISPTTSAWMRCSARSMATMTPSSRSSPAVRSDPAEHQQPVDAGPAVRPARRRRQLELQHDAGQPHTSHQRHVLPRGPRL